jgi:hypothetical protein
MTTTVRLRLRTPDERRALRLARKNGGFVTSEALLRCAVWKLARHLDVPMTEGEFDLAPRRRSTP